MGDRNSGNINEPLLFVNDRTVAQQTEVIEQGMNLTETDRDTKDNEAGLCGSDPHLHRQDTLLTETDRDTKDNKAGLCAPDPHLHQQDTLLIQTDRDTIRTMKQDCVHQTSSPARYACNGD